MTTEMHKAPSVAHNTGTSGDNATSVARYDLSTSEGGRRYVADFFARELRRHDFARYITTTLAADFACALAQHLAATGKQQVGELQGEALKQLQELISRIHSTVSLGHQTGPHAYAGEDFGRYLAEAAGDCQQIMRALAALAARQPGAQEPVVVEAVATIKLDRDGEFYVDWLTEGGIHDLSVGDVLLAANSAITNDEGYGEVYAAPPAQGIDLYRLVPPVWISEPVGGPLDDLTPGQAWRQGFNQCRDRTLLLVEQALGFPTDQQRDAAPGVGNGSTCKDSLQVASCRKEKSNG